MTFMRSIPTAVILTLCSAGVGATPPMEEHIDKLAAEYNAKVDNERRQVVCDMVAKVGTRIKQPECRTNAQIKFAEDEGMRYAKKPKLSYKSN